MQYIIDPKIKRSNTKTRVSGVNYRVEGKLYQETQETKNCKKKYAFESEYS